VRALGQAVGSRTLEGLNPKGASSRRWAKHLSLVMGLRGRAKARKPVVVTPAGAVRRAGASCGLTAGGCGGRGNPVPPPGRRRLRRGKSQERCRDERGPTGRRGEQAATRVAKP
jgi:hypothetical protein